LKQFKTLVALVLALALTMTVVGSAMAAELTTGTKGADKTITITPPNGVAADATNTYTVYKIFNADSNGTAISYKSIDGTAPAGFVVDDAQNVYLGTATDTASGATGEITIKVSGATKYIVPSTAQELTADQIAAIATYTGKVAVGTVTITGTTETTVTVPDYGYYYITTTTGTVVTIDSTHKSAEVTDKNTIPGLDKKITNTDSTAAGMAGTIDADGKKALAELGKEVEYTATITVGKGAKGYEFHDKMGTGLTFKGNSSVTVTAEPAQTGTWYTIKDAPDSGDTLTITFVDGIAENTKITIKYIGIVNSDALTIDTGKNTARVDYGDENSNNHTPDSETNVYNAKFTVTKNDGKNQPLAGAGFVVKNTNNKYYKKEGTVVSWVDNIDQATENFSIADGSVPSFTGLVDGTYTLIEKTVPAGYNKAADSTFTIAANDYTGENLVQTATVVNNSGAELPSTGGIGTTIFYIAGLVLVLGAAAIVIARRKAEQN
jgi:fimbrial isopeptide formation D2 family protein/LPXTG-motif cell wall-anchored protein